MGDKSGRVPLIREFPKQKPERPRPGVSPDEQADRIRRLIRAVAKTDSLPRASPERAAAKEAEEWAVKAVADGLSQLNR